MIEESKDYVTKSKLTITVKALSKYNNRSRVVVKQTNKENGKHLGRKAKSHIYK